MGEHISAVRPRALSCGQASGSGGLTGLAAVQEAYPTAWAAQVYLGLMAFQLLLAFVMPGKDQQGEVLLRSPHRATRD